MRVLHAGCGYQPLPSELSECFGDIDEVRLDIDPDVGPHILASIDDMGEVGEFDVVYCCHALEHLHRDDAERALSEFYRVLRPGGFAILMVPDLEDVRPTHDVLYEINGLRITGHDLFYGHRPYAARNAFMRHNCGFIPSTLKSAMEDAGFQHVKTVTEMWNLMAQGIKL